MSSGTQYSTTRFIVKFWIGVAFLLSGWTLLQDTSQSERIVYSDIANHVMIASSVWHDFDFKYTISDLNRFRSDYPSASGPTGLFLKKTLTGELVYAKQNLYGTVAAPFYGLMGVKGFLVLNSLCVALVGFLATLSLKSGFGERWGLLASIAFLFPSPFLAWLEVPHPDILIATILASSIYIILTEKNTKSLVIGAMLLGAAIYEKPPFIILIPFIFLASSDTRGFIKLATISSAAIVSLFILSLPNILSDGTLLSYQGFRFATTGAPFPLEPGWSPPLRKEGITAHIFNLSSLFSALLNNISILPEKFLDFLFGRQTGIIPYFPIAFLLLLAGALAKGRGKFLLLGFMGYLVLNWLAFPTNGYGGSGSYGPRYMMQALPLIPLAWIQLNVDEAKVTTTRWMKRLIPVLALIALAVNYKTIFPHTDLVRLHFKNFTEYPLALFPSEKWLTPNIMEYASDSSTKIKKSSNEILYSTTHFTNSEFLKNSRQGTDLLFQKNKIRQPPDLFLWNPEDSRASLSQDDKILWEGTTSKSQPVRISLRELEFNREAFDLQEKAKIRFADLNTTSDGTSKDLPILQFWGPREQFQAYGDEISSPTFSEKGIEFLTGWSQVEPWGVWTDGELAQFSVKLSEVSSKYLVKLNLNAYTPGEISQNIKLYVNNKFLTSVQFDSDQNTKEISFELETEADEEFMVFRFSIENPISPAALKLGSDTRSLGVGLLGFRLDKVEES